MKRAAVATGASEAIQRVVRNVPEIKELWCGRLAILAVGVAKSWTATRQHVPFVLASANSLVIVAVAKDLPTDQDEDVGVLKAGGDVVVETASDNSRISRLNKEAKRGDVEA